MGTSIWARVAVETQAVVELLQEKHLWARNQPHRKSVKKGSINVKMHSEEECEFILGRLHFN